MYRTRHLEREIRFVDCELHKESDTGQTETEMGSQSLQG